MTAIKYGASELLSMVFLYKLQWISKYRPTMIDDAISRGFINLSGKKIKVIFDDTGFLMSSELSIDLPSIPKYGPFAKKSYSHVIRLGKRPATIREQTHDRILKYYK